MNTERIQGTQNEDSTLMRKTFLYLVENGVFASGIPKYRGTMAERDTGGASREKDDDIQYYLSSKGTEIWDRMLTGDSVLFEAYREDYYQDFPDAGAAETDQFHSSWDLMDEDRQEFIFVEQYRLLAKLYEKEREMVDAAADNGAAAKLKNCFGSEHMVAHLKRGVDCSVGYSGKWGYEVVKEEKEKLERLLGEKTC